MILHFIVNLIRAAEEAGLFYVVENRLNSMLKVDEQLVLEATCLGACNKQPPGVRYCFEKTDEVSLEQPVARETASVFTRS